MHFIEDNLIGMVYAEEASCKGQGGDYAQGEFVVPLMRYRLVQVIKGLLQCSVIVFFVSVHRRFAILFRTPLAQGRIGSRHIKGLPGAMGLRMWLR
jgi:hypothetical protein